MPLLCPDCDEDQKHEGVRDKDEVDTDGLVLLLRLDQLFLLDRRPLPNYNLKQQDEHRSEDPKPEAARRPGMF